MHHAVSGGRGADRTKTLVPHHLSHDAVKLRKVFPLCSLPCFGPWTHQCCDGFIVMEERSQCTLLHKQMTLKCPAQNTHTHNFCRLRMAYRWGDMARRDWKSCKCSCDNLTHVNDGCTYQVHSLTKKQQENSSALCTQPNNQTVRSH